MEIIFNSLHLYIKKEIDSNCYNAVQSKIAYNGEMQERNSKVVAGGRVKRKKKRNNERDASDWGCAHLKLGSVKEGGGGGGMMLKMSHVSAAHKYTRH